MFLNNKAVSSGIGYWQQLNNQNEWNLKIPKNRTGEVETILLAAANLAPSVDGLEAAYLQRSSCLKDMCLKTSASKTCASKTCASKTFHSLTNSGSNSIHMNLIQRIRINWIRDTTTTTLQRRIRRSDWLTCGAAEALSRADRVKGLGFRTYLQRRTSLVKGRYERLRIVSG
jgi:hypothetical protein